jgi:thiol:disulfide interchange protein DsbC
MFMRSVATIVFIAASFPAAAADPGEALIRETFKKLSPNGNITAVVKSELPGFYQVLVGSNVYFVSADGKYLINGNVFDIDTRQDIGEKQVSAMRQAELAKIPASKEIIFAPENPKYTVTVFTDVDCPYCRAFHKQIDEFNKLGVAVKYVFYPLPIHPGADKKAETVWCSSDRNAAYTTAMTGAWDAPRPEPKNNKPIGQEIADAVKKDPSPATAAAAPARNEYKALTCDNPIAELTAMGKAMGVDGTPAIYNADGQHVGGFMAPDQLVKKLDQLAQRSSALTAK